MGERKNMIKASDLSFKDLIGYDHQDGERFLKEHHMMITSAEAWGVLRKDLITALGVERAKRFLLRYGWHCGMHEARVLKDTFKWSDDLEWLIAGSRMHNIAGRVFSYPNKFNVDLKAKKFDVSGYWIKSYEAEQHLQHFSLHHEPICYFLVGYAGGYTSECVGKRIIFKEVDCMGKGDSHCSYIGKTIEEWGEDIGEDLLDYGEESMADELDRVYRRVEKQKEALKIGSSISQQLTKALLQGSGLKSFAEIIHKSIHCPVTIENQHFDLVTQCGHFPDIPHTLKEQIMINGEHINVVIEKLMDDQRPLQYLIPNTNVKMLIAPIVIQKKVYGFISLVSDSAFTDIHIDVLERVTTSAALQILHERTAIETEQRLKGELLEQLLNDKKIDPNIITTRLAYFGYNLNRPHYVLVFQIEGEDVEQGILLPNSSSYVGFRNKIIETIRKELDITGDRLLVSAKLNKVYTIISEDFLQKKLLAIKEFGTKLLKQLYHEKYFAFLGISHVSRNIHDFHKLFNEANKAIELAKMRQDTSTVIMASELGHLTILLNARHPEELIDFANRKLEPLSEYDEKTQSELLKTLYFYAENEFNLHKTARGMNVSISGMRYRIQRIEEMIDMDLSTSTNRFEVHLALQIFLIFGKIHSK